MSNDEFQMTKEIRMTKPEGACSNAAIRHSGFGILSEFAIRHS